MTEIEKLLLGEVQGLRRESGEEFRQVKLKIGEVQMVVARLDQKTDDHSHDTSMHPPTRNRPCDELKRHLSRHWAVLLSLLIVLAGEVIAAIGLLVKLMGNQT